MQQHIRRLPTIEGTCIAIRTQHPRNLKGVSATKAAPAKPARPRRRRAVPTAAPRPRRARRPPQSLQRRRGSAARRPSGAGNLAARTPATPGSMLGLCAQGRALCTRESLLLGSGSSTCSCGVDESGEAQAQRSGQNSSKVDIHGCIEEDQLSQNWRPTCMCVSSGAECSAAAMPPAKPGGRSAGVALLSFEDSRAIVVSGT